MGREVKYEIARYAVDGDEEVLLEQFQLVTDDGALYRLGPDEARSACDSASIVTIIGGDIALTEIRADQVTRITVDRAIADVLPMLLTIPGDVSASDEWSKAMSDKHLDRSTTDRDMYRVAYVGEARWYAYDTVDGLRMLPENPSAVWQNDPPLIQNLGQISFSEEGGMATGTDTSTLGLITPSVIATLTHLDSSSDSVTIGHRGNDAETLTDWIMNGDIANHYSYGRDDDGAAMLTQLIVEAGLSEKHGTNIRGDALAAGIAKYGDTMASSPTGWWSLSLEVDAPMIGLILDRISARASRLADIVAAGRQPDSPLAKARAAALQQLEDTAYDGEG